MTREDAKKLLRYLVDCYPNFRPADMQETIEAWAKTLEEYDSREISFAAKIYVQTDTSGFPPSIGQLIEKAHSAKSPELDEMEAWSLVMSGIGNSIYHAEEEYNKLPEVCQKAIGSPAAVRPRYI